MDDCIVRTNRTKRKDEENESIHTDNQTNGEFIERSE